MTEPAADVTFRPLTRADLPALLRWLATPHVLEWWPGSPGTLAALEAKYGPSIDGTHPVERFVIEADSIPAGLIQRYRHADQPDWDRAVGIPDAAGLDYLIGEPTLTGRGLGSTAIRAFTATVFTRYPEITAVVAVPQAANFPSRRALEKAGYLLDGIRDLESGDPADAGPSAVYVTRRSPSGYSSVS
ncbi:GNAT family N-acetyltransferase [Longispora albida]|uniref:GNAT family N-acetyltransferase n=1 Tax=Longispora albida TaxID=203523 RepID=UPI000372D898|nr:GNAT family N-acetyltransferase [Longispora albida]